MSKHPQCTNENCDEDGFVVEPPGCFYGDVYVEECRECIRLFQRDHYYETKKEEL